MCASRLRMSAVGIGEAFESTLVAAQAGAEWAFAQLYGEFNHRLLRYFAARAPDAADDLTAETWFGAAKALGEFRGDETQFRSWLFTIAHRRLADYWKQRPTRAESVDPSRLMDRVGTESADRRADEIMSADEAVRRIVRSLSPDQADVILLRVLGDLDVEEVASILGKRPGAVRALQHRALQKLKREISMEGVTE
jgi:RNA polymerase sigma factor (sigma-70 family)